MLASVFECVCVCMCVKEGSFRMSVEVAPSGGLLMNVPSNLVPESLWEVIIIMSHLSFFFEQKFKNCKCEI